MTQQIAQGGRDLCLQESKLKSGKPFFFLISTTYLYQSVVAAWRTLGEIEVCAKLNKTKIFNSLQAFNHFISFKYGKANLP